MALVQFLQKLGSYPRSVLDSVTDWAVHALTDPVRLYSPTEATDVRSLKNRLELGDVVLVCGNARISSVVKLLTTSPWSHVVLYVGDRRDLLTEQEKEEWSATFGEASMKHLVIDADPVRRVHLKPIDEYAGLMLRHCRAEAITPDDAERVVDSALSQLGRMYDVKHILRLLLFFSFPWELLPETLRRFSSDFTLSETDRICSRVVSEAFHSVGYPIRHSEIVRDRGALHNTALGFAFGLRHRGKSAAKLLAGGRVRAAFTRLTDKRYTEIHLKGERHITPADYDLSRFFSIIKDDDDLSIDYKNARSLCAFPRG
ncbi:MAG: hypothetical protein U0136_03170 [Bdellovibrionota bacterium]